VANKTKPVNRTFEENCEHDYAPGKCPAAQCSSKKLGNSQAHTPGPLKWKRDGATLVSGIFEIAPKRGYDRSQGGDYTEWELRINGVWDETFSRLKDAKAAAIAKAQGDK
jgi:hypothetical protein